MLPSPNPTDERRERRSVALLGAVFAAVVGLATIDLGSDLAEGNTTWHVLVEGLLVAFGSAGIVAVARRFVRLMRRERVLVAEAAELNRRLDRTIEEAERWRKEASDLLAGLGEAIDAQFGRWGLTPAEKEVALLLLKGLSMKEVAQMRGVGESTTRQQARAVYKKAWVSGRYDLSAFFLEDLLLPAAAE